MPSFRKEDFKANAKVYTYHCVKCSREFYSNRPRVQFCSSTCRNYQWRLKGALETSPVGEPKGKSSLTEKELDALIQEMEAFTASTQSPSAQLTPAKGMKIPGLKHPLTGVRVVSLLELAKALEEQIKELQYLKQTLQWSIEEELFEKMCLQGRDTIATNMLPALEAMENKHQGLMAMINQVKGWEMYLLTPVKGDGEKGLS